MLHEKIVKQIFFEISQVDKLLETYEELLDKCLSNEPDVVEMTALAGVLHSFYNGIESIFLAIAKNFDASVPNGSNWHKELLVQMTKEIGRRKPILNSTRVDDMADFMAFRHYFRHAYSFTLDWVELENLVKLTKPTWDSLKEDLQLFLDWPSAN